MVNVSNLISIMKYRYTSMINSCLKDVGERFIMGVGTGTAGKAFARPINHNNNYE